MVNLAHVYATNRCLDLGELGVAPHGHGWPVTANLLAPNVPMAVLPVAVGPTVIVAVDDGTTNVVQNRVYRGSVGGPVATVSKKTG